MHNKYAHFNCIYYYTSNYVLSFFFGSALDGQVLGVGETESGYNIC